MPIDLWVAALRMLAAVLTISILWPALLQPWRWLRRARVGNGRADNTLP